MLLETFTSDELIDELVKRHEKTGNINKLELHKDEVFCVKISKKTKNTTQITHYYDTMDEHDDGHIIIVKY